MGKRAPALGRKVKPGPRERDLGYLLHRRLPGETSPYELIYGTAVAPTQFFPLEIDERAGRLAEDPGD